MRAPTVTVAVGAFIFSRQNQEDDRSERMRSYPTYELPEKRSERRPLCWSEGFPVDRRAI